MTDSAQAQVFVECRVAWLRWLAQRVISDRRASGLEGLDGLDSVERALIVVHVGLGHMLGIADENLAIEGYLSPDEAIHLISRWWRSGGADALTTTEIIQTWQALFQVGRDTDLVSNQLLRKVATSEVGARMRAESKQNLDAERSDPGELSTWFSEEVDPIRPEECKGAVFPWDCEGSHLSILRGLIERDGLESLQGQISYLELTAALPASEDDLRDIDALESAASIGHVYLSIPGAWPGPDANDVPAWVRDVVTVRGARSYQSSAGFVSGWLLVASTEEQLRAMNRWSHGGGLGIDLSEDSCLTFVVPIEFSEDDIAYISYSYPLSSRELFNWAQTILSVGTIRVELYELDQNLHLKFVATFGFLLPLELIERAKAHIRNFMEGEQEIQIFHHPSSADWLIHLAQLERAFFENLALCLPELFTGSALGEEYKRNLELLAAASSVHLGGGLVDRAGLEDSRQSLETEITKFPRPPLRPIDLHLLGVGRALVQFTVTSDEPASLRAVAAFQDHSGSVFAESFEFSSSIDLRFQGQSIEDVCAYLTDGLRQLSALLDRGISSIVVSTGAGIYNLPFHEALMSLGFAQVSYSHRLATLGQRSSVPSVVDALVLADSGQGANKIPAVDVEVQIISGLVETSGDSLFHSPLPSLVHLAGHAVTGSKDYEVGIWIDGADKAPLSPAKVLLDVDASNTKTVFLSACSTGAGIFPIGEVIGAIPLDVAFIEKGAQVVVSTAAPINDQIACFFACVFHDALRRGEGIWSAYMTARRSAESGSLDPTDNRLIELLDKHWPSWSSDIASRNQNEAGAWRLFRISGRHW